MSLFKSWKSDGAVFAIWKVEETGGELRAMLGDSLPYDAELSALRAESRRTEYLAVRVLLKALCGEEKQVGHFPSGKPFLTDQSYRLSISHTRGYVAVALHPSAEVGVDIEQVADRVLRIAGRFMCAEELDGETEAVKGFAGDSRTSTLYYMLLHWSAKETLYKLMGEEEVDFREHLRIMPFHLQQQGDFVAGAYKSFPPASYQVCYMVHPDFVCTWSVQAKKYF